MSIVRPVLVSALLQGPPLPAGPLGQALIAIIAIAVVILVGRIVLSIAWRLVLIASVVIGALWLLSIVL
ncbi:MAG: hypothetical protein V5A38_12045 [Halolamina sp.]|uniref:hypothetical protein n=1 Tax=Halolamina sp. TaxID=1940283 RepID=UPI002FC3D3BD